MTQLTQRDDLGNTDAFGFMLDTYGNGTDGVIFVIGATGVQYDALKFNGGWEDGDWDAVWESAVSLSDEGWICEMKIPYAAIRFSKAEEQDWTINFVRSQRRLNMNSSWSEIDPLVDGVFTQSGKVTNIKNIEPSYRLSVTPYLSTYATRFHDENSDPVNSTGYSYNAGMDIKYGINDAFTLDMTLIPDFGQVEADDLVVNLSPFEVRLSEKRPFFTEGLELFSKANLFYTRRIGGTALNFYEAGDDLSSTEVIVSNPQIPQLYNATKISGRNKNGLGLGLFNAVEAPTDAVAEDEETGNTRKIRTQPLTNYSVIVVDQNLKNNSNISFINTNVYRHGADFHNANVFGTEFSLKDKNQDWNFYGSGAVSSTAYADMSGRKKGYKFEFDLDKISGAWQYGLNYDEISKDYDQNDLGFQWKTNEREMGVFVSYNKNKPFWILNSAFVNFGFDNTYLIDPHVYTGTSYSLSFSGQTKKFWWFNLWFNVSSESKDYFEPRTDDFSRFVLRPDIKNVGFYVSTNQNKKFSMWWNGGVYNLNEEGRWGYFGAMGPYIQFNDKLSTSFRWNYNVQYDDTGWLDNGPNGEIYFGQRDNYRVTNLWRIEYTLNNKMGFQFRTRHNWTKIVYNTFHELAEDGSLPLSDYDEDLDFTFNFFSIDCGFSWRFAPGSDINLVWKNNIAGAFTDPALDYRSRNYFNGLGALNDFPNQNSLSLRITYYLDQTNFKKWF